MEVDRKAQNAPQLRVLHVIGKMDCGGAETLLMNLYRSIDRDVIQFDFLVHSPERGDCDDEIEALGGKIHYLIPFIASNLPRYRSVCRASSKQHQGQYPIVHGHIGNCAAINLSEAKRLGACASLTVMLRRTHFRRQSWRSECFRFQRVM